MLRERSYYQKIREDAYKDEEDALNPDWKRAFVNLAIAADHLDACLARCTDCGIEAE